MLIPAQHQDEYLDPPGMVFVWITFTVTFATPPLVTCPSLSLLFLRHPAYNWRTRIAARILNTCHRLHLPRERFVDHVPPLLPRSRSPSPTRSSTPSVPGSRTHSRTSSIDGRFSIPVGTRPLGLAQANGKLPSPLHLESTIIPVVEPPTPIVKISEKVMGKRRLVELDPRR